METGTDRILLSGASGLLGTALRQAFDARRAPVLQLVRGAGLQPAAAPGRFVWNPAATPPFASTATLEGVRAAIHLSGANLGAHRWTPAFRRELVASRVASTGALALALAGLQRPPTVLLVASAVGVYGDRGNELLDEDSAPGSGFLADLCQQWEQAADPARAAGIRVVHLRLGVILASGGALGRIAPLFRMGLGGPLGSGRQWMSWIALADAARAVLFALDQPALAGPINLTAPQAVTNAEFTAALAHQLRRPAIFRAPALALRLALGSMADETLLSSALVAPARLLHQQFTFLHPTLQSALQAAFAPAKLP
jgi:hypothetical protein